MILITNLLGKFHESIPLWNEVKYNYLSLLLPVWSGAPQIFRCLKSETTLPVKSGDFFLYEKEEKLVSTYFLVLNIEYRRTKLFFVIEDFFIYCI